MGSFNKKGKSPGWRRDGHWLIDDRTGMAIREQDAREEWTGSVVAKEDWEPRSPLDFYRAIQDDTSPQGLVRTESPDNEKEPYYDWGYIANGYFDIE